MNEFEIVKHIMMLDHVSYDDLSERLGYKSKSTSYHRLDGKHIYVDTWRKFLDELGYEIVVRKKSKSGKEYVVNEDNYPSSLRFHEMDLNLEAVLNGTPRHSKKPKALIIRERHIQSRELKSRISELPFHKCDIELQKIWDIVNASPKSEDMIAYENYRKELKELYTNREKA